MATVVLQAYWHGSSISAHGPLGQRAHVEYPADMPGIATGAMS